MLGHAVLVSLHANCHRADLESGEALDGSHVFLDHVGETTNAVVAWYPNAPTRLRHLRRLSQALHITPLQHTSLAQRRRPAFTARALRPLLRTYLAMVCLFFLARPPKAKDKEQRRALLLALTDWVFIAGLHLLADLLSSPVISAHLRSSIQVMNMDRTAPPKRLRTNAYEVSRTLPA